MHFFWARPAPGKAIWPGHRASGHRPGLSGDLPRGAHPARGNRRSGPRWKTQRAHGSLATVPLLIIDDLGMRKLGPTAAEELLEIVRRRYERASTLVTSNRPVVDWGKPLGDSAAVTAMLDRLLHHGHILKCGPRSWRTKTGLPDQEKAG